MARAEDEELDPSSALERIELTGQLWRAIAKLPRRDREVIALRFGAGLPPAEIAETLNETANAVSSRLSRALGSLARALDDEPELGEHSRGFGLPTLFTVTLMKKNVTLLVVLAALAGLFPLGFRMLDREGAPEPFRETLEPELVDVTVSGMESALGEFGAGDVPAREAAVPEALPGAAVVDVDAPVVPSKGTVRVRVVEAVTGSPAVSVCLELVEFYGGAHWDHVQRSLTDSQGILEFNGLSAGPRTVYLCRVDPHGSFDARRVAVEAGETTEVKFEVDGTAVVHGRVVDETGAAVPGARIWLASGVRAASHGEFVASTDQRGRFDVRYVGRTQFLSVSALGFTPSPSAAFGIGEPTDENGRFLLVLGTRRGTVRGRVVDSEAAPVGGALVALGSLRSFSS